MTLRNTKQDLTPDLIDTVYLKGTRTDEELYAKLVLPVVEEAKAVEEPVSEDTPETAEEPVKAAETPAVEANTPVPAIEEVVDTPTNTEKEE